jgi:hypothetical protein
MYLRHTIRRKDGKVHRYWCLVRSVRATHGQIRLRCVSQPDAAQATLLDRLGIVLPKRMRLAEHELPIRVLSACPQLLRKNVVATFSLRH